ncbi:MAG: UDP-N-acetylglucosamine 1-carboxyvinyltransferase [Bacteroidetes bacterium HGW-Bacteroidetes-6]|jgi:UDP-N-acetylglucosamine 1-carboxyvinyltransferase|nr:MAG: UDP-N-acetylglucosamine 1-carboxyvinyltransferase [Bacteroidetes bacterium HGW-Bacteroidetes-6]
MSSYFIQGGRTLHGEIVPQGAKNEALQVISAVLLTEKDVEISNVPEIRDVIRLIELLDEMGVAVSKSGQSTYVFNAANINMGYLQTPEFISKAGSLRGSVMILGPLLTRFGTASIPKPGGDKIGRRRMDTHLLGFKALGAELDFDTYKNFYTVSVAGRLRGAKMLLEEASVTGTANIIMAAVLADGQTTIYNAACEPYIQQLCRMLNNMGARIVGIGSNLLEIEGVNSLQGTTHRMLPDMIEVGSFIGLAAMTQSELLIKDASVKDLGIIPETFRRLGITIIQQGDDLFIPAKDEYVVESYLDGGIMTIADAPWPGFTPDLLSIALVVSTQAKGSVLIHQKMFESRLFFVDKLIDMGAQIILCDPHRATVIGIDRKYPLRGIEMTSPDIRAGVSLLIAAMSAKGTSEIHNIEQIDRGYQFFDERLRALGADIERKG